MKLLIIEDDKNLNNSLKELLSSFGSVDVCYDGSDAIYMTSQNIYDLIILDLMLPYVSGLDVLTNIRKTSNVPVLILTAKITVTDKVKAFSLGADDYLTKPYHNDELIARVSALLRRTNNEFRDLSLSFLDMRFDLQNKSVFIKDERIDLIGKHYEILEYLVRKKDNIITKLQLFNRIWGYDSETIWSVVEVYVSYIRKVLKPYGYNKYLKTIRNSGYMWSERDYEA